MFFNSNRAQPLAGGKFNGLVKLKEAGFRVPPFFGWKLEEETDVQVMDWLSGMPTAPLAVRSSGLAEDGAVHSFAGQYHSILRVLPKPEAVRQAAIQITAQANNSRVELYAQKGGIKMEDDGNLPLVIQTMVEPIWSGVLFTVDPVSKLQDRMLLSCVAGDAEALVGGEVNGYSVHLPCWGEKQGVPPDGHGLPDAFLPFIEELWKGAKQAEQLLGMPADLEWAIDAQGTLFWLQMRPITTLDVVNPHELDAQLTDGEALNSLFTLGNIGEMMPGAVTPLTAEIFGASIDAGLIDFASRSGVPKPNPQAERRYVQTYYYRLFFNLTNLYDFCRFTALNQRDNIELSIVGRSLGLEPIPLQVNKFKAVLNFVGQLRYLISAKSRLKQLETMCAQPAPNWSMEVPILVEQLEEARRVMDLGFCHHFATSSSSGSNYTALVRTIMAKLKLDRQSAQGLANTWLTGIGSVESADPLSKLQNLAEQIKKQVPSNSFDGTADGLLHWLQEKAPADLQQAWHEFILRHGHRGIREAELSTPSWAQDLESLAHLLLQLMAIPERGDANKTFSTKESDSGWAAHQPKGLVLNYFLRQARQSVINREKSKAMSIKLLSRLKTGFRQWGTWASNQGIIDKEEDVFFLLTKEIQAASKSGQSLKKQVERRKEAYELCSKLNFSDVLIGKPFPLFASKSISTNENEWLGVPVSPGIATGRVRLVKTPADAAKLEAEDILVSGFTDIGWTPYYGVVKGMVTEMGSPLSHGAVVAREYGLPAVVGISGICSALKDGDRIEINGMEGIVRRL